jgi:lysophospholipase L1-like esterase
VTQLGMDDAYGAGHMKSLACALFATVGGCAATAEQAPPVNDEPVYLALGDSIAFGYDPLVDQQRDVAGYPEAMAARMGIALTNASCPGEATGGFISPDGVDNGCRENRVKYPLHATYPGTQLAFALEFLKEHPNTQLVTIDIGANDAKKLQNECAGASSCVLGGFLGMLGEYVKHLDFIFSEIRKVYDGPLVALQIYNPLPADSLAVYGVERLNTTIATEVAKFDGTVADGFSAFTAVSADPCKDGLLIAMPDGTCDIHTSPRGDELLADAIDTALDQVR